MRRITVNQCRMRQRRRREAIAWEEIPRETISHADTPAMLAEGAELRRRVHEAIAALPEAQRLAVTLFYLSGMSCEEAGRFLGVGANAVKGRLHRARLQLKEALMESMEEVMNEQKPGEAFTADVLREIQKYEEQARFHQGAIHAIGQLVPGAKGNVAVIVLKSGRGILSLDPGFSRHYSSSMVRWFGVRNHRRPTPRQTDCADRHANHRCGCRAGAQLGGNPAVRWGRGKAAGSSVSGRVVSHAPCSVPVARRQGAEGA